MSTGNISALLFASGKTEAAVPRSTAVATVVPALQTARFETRRMGSKMLVLPGMRGW